MKAMPRTALKYRNLSEEELYRRFEKNADEDLTKEFNRLVADYTQYVKHRAKGPPMRLFRGLLRRRGNAPLENYAIREAILQMQEYGGFLPHHRHTDQ